MKKKLTKKEQETAKAGTAEEYAKWVCEQQEQAKQATDAYLEHLAIFRDTYRHIAERQKVCEEIAIAAVAVSIVGTLSGLIALIVTVV